MPGRQETTFISSVLGLATHERPAARGPLNRPAGLPPPSVDSLDIHEGGVDEDRVAAAHHRPAAPLKLEGLRVKAEQ